MPRDAATPESSVAEAIVSNQESQNLHRGGREGFAEEIQQFSVSFSVLRDFPRALRGKDVDVGKLHLKHENRLDVY
jgi:hypothetical protein